MSATGRAGGVRREHDVYVTPEWVARLVVPLVPELHDPRAVVLDPACGNGSLLAALLAGGATCGVMGYELREDAALAAAARFGDLCVRCMDAMSAPWGSVGAVVMNPPYSLALEFVQRACAETRKGGSVAALLRLAFLEGQARGAWLRTNAPDVHVLSKRPSFTGGGTDSTAYAWFIWRAGVMRTSGRVEVLPC